MDSKFEIRCAAHRRMVGEIHAAPLIRFGMLIANPARN